MRKKKRKGKGGRGEERRVEETKRKTTEERRCARERKGRLSHGFLISKNADDRLAHFRVTPVPSKMIF